MCFFQHIPKQLAFVVTTGFDLPVDTYQFHWKRVWKQCQRTCQVRTLMPKDGRRMGHDPALQQVATSGADGDVGGSHLLVSNPLIVGSSCFVGDCWVTGECTDGGFLEAHWVLGYWFALWLCKLSGPLPKQETKTRA